jgi:hypothetical protein
MYLDFALNSSLAGMCGTNPASPIACTDFTACENPADTTK